MKGDRGRKGAEGQLIGERSRRGGGVGGWENGRGSGYRLLPQWSTLSVHLSVLPTDQLKC